MLVLVDSGSSSQFVDRIQCLLVDIAPLKIKVANGGILWCKQEANDLHWWIQGHTFHNNAKVIDLGGYDMVLGM